MIFHTDKLICTIDELLSAIEDREFITYATVNSFRVAPRLSVDFKFVADGWPVAVYSSFKLRKRVRRLSFFRCESFWFDISSRRRVAIVGHAECELRDIDERARLKGIRFERLVCGYAATSHIAKELEHLIGKVDLIFLAVSQPKQEEVINLFSANEGKVAVVCCGAFWLQALGIEAGVSSIPTALGLVPLSRFYKNPSELVRRTIGSLPSMFRNLRVR